MSVFDEDYFMDGIRQGRSNYENYRWLPELTIPACQKVVEYLGIRIGESLLDIGCSRGFYVRAFRGVGIKAWGSDISEWAIANCDPLVTAWVSNQTPDRAFDWVHAKDVAEHIPQDDLARLLSRLNRTVSKGMLFIVPLAVARGGRYVRVEDERDATHVIRWTLEDWINFFEEAAPGFNVNASFHIHGIKPASATDLHSCGFFTLIRP